MTAAASSAQPCPRTILQPASSPTAAANPAPGTWPTTGVRSSPDCAHSTPIVTSRVSAEVDIGVANGFVRAMRSMMPAASSSSPARSAVTAPPPNAAPETLLALLRPAAASAMTRSASIVFIRRVCCAILV